MEENKFFKLVWRFNGLVISVAATLAIGVLIFASYEIYKSTTRDRATRNIVNIEESEQLKQDWHYGQLLEVSGTNHLMLPLRSNQSFDRTYFSKSSSSIRNYLFINTETFQKKWLFNHSNYLIESTNKLSLGDYDSKARTVAILYQLVKLDSDHNSLLTPDDLITIAITKVDGSSYKELINDVELIIDYSLIDELRLFLIYQKDGTTYSVIIDLENLELIKNEELPKVDL